MLNRLLLAISVHIAVISSSVNTSTYSNSLSQCSEIKNNSLDFCLKELIEGIRPFFSTGIPEINFPVLEPITVDAISLEVEDASLSAQLSTLQMRGLSKFVAKNVTANPDTMSMQWVLNFPELRMVGKYKISGKVFSLAIEGSGTFWMIMGNVTAEAHQKLALRETYKKEKRLYVIEQQLDMKYDKMRMRLNNLFNGDRVLGETVNAFLNENHRELFNEYKKDIFKPVSKVLSSVVDGALATFSPKHFVKEQSQQPSA